MSRNESTFRGSDFKANATAGRQDEETIEGRLGIAMMERYHVKRLELFKNRYGDIIQQKGSQKAHHAKRRDKQREVSAASFVWYTLFQYLCRKSASAKPAPPYLHNTGLSHPRSSRQLPLRPFFISRISMVSGASANPGPLAPCAPSRSL